MERGSDVYQFTESQRHKLRAHMEQGPTIPVACVRDLLSWVKQCEDVMMRSREAMLEMARNAEDDAPDYNEGGIGHEACGELGRMLSIGGNLAPQLLKCEDPDRREEVMDAARSCFGEGVVTAHFEHGQWWVIGTVTGAQYSVVDAEGIGSVGGFGFEQVSGGDEQ